MSSASGQRPLRMRANRHLGAALVDASLLKLEHLEAANERFLELAATDNPRQTTLLGILAYEHKVLREEDVLQHAVDEHGIGLVDLREYDLAEEIKSVLDLDVCWATWSLPFDREEDFHFVATASYLSPAVRSLWEKRLGGPVIWYGTTLEMIADALEKIAADRERLPPRAT